MIAAIVGADGAGKSTVTAAVGDRLGARATVIDRWDIVGDPAYPTAGFIQPDVRHLRTCTALMSPPARLLFLLWTSVASITERAALGEVVLLDGHWMKHAASEIAYGLDQSWVERVVAGLPAVDTVIYLRSDPETAWGRLAGRVVPYECAMDLTCARSSFLDHQKKIHAVFDGWAAEHGWITVDARRPLEDVIGATLESIHEG
ncbi:hypothetical protein J5X84_27815 [Streptosporangiaceae bacterium NEAU-GS5]|nr:hypothetical protein [Streptosporangiaceae bacterium NEAU-GS5]